MSNDAARPSVQVPVSGRGITLTESPIIDSLAWASNYISDVRVIWFRSNHDTLGDADPVTDCSVWRLSNDVWEFAATVPALHFSRYSAEVSRGTDNSHYPSTIIMVAAKSRSGQVFLSDPDTLFWFSPVISNAAERGKHPSKVVLEQNFPNPFNPATTIRYSLPQRSAVHLSIYNTLGQEIALLADTLQDAGDYQVVFDGSPGATAKSLHLHISPRQRRVRAIDPCCSPAR